MKSKSGIGISSLLLSLSLSLSLSAQATTIDLSGAAEGGVYTYGASPNGPEKYTAQGFQFAAVAPAGNNDAHFHVDYLGAGTVLMHNNSIGYPATWVLSKVGGGLFNATSFTGIGGGLLWSTNLNNTWNTDLVGLNTINQNGISSLSFILSDPSSCCSIGMDAFEVSAVPEPATNAFLLAGLAMVGFMARRRKQLDA